MGDASSDSGTYELDLPENLPKGFRQAALEALGIKTNTKYTTLEQDQLQACADEEAWMPEEVLTVLADDTDDINIDLVNKDCDLNLVMAHLKKHSNSIALTVIGPAVNRKVKIYMIVLATREKIFALPPDDERNIKFIREVARKKNFQLHTSNLLYLADSLNKHFNIKLRDDNITDCPSMHIGILLQLKKMTKTQNTQYIRIKNLRDASKPRFESLETLAENYLEVPRAKLRYSASQLGHLRTYPLNITAQNIIKKCCILILPLARRLEHEYMKNIRNITSTSNHYLRDLSDDASQYILNTPDFCFDALSHIAYGPAIERTN